MDGCPAVAHHEYVLGVGKQHLQIVHGLERQGVLVAQPGRRHPVTGDDFEDERSDGGVDDFIGDAGFFQPKRLLGRFVPMVAHLQDSRHHPRLLATPVAHGPSQNVRHRRVYCANTFSGINAITRGL